jgi:hypothetical protein
MFVKRVLKVVGIVFGALLVAALVMFYLVVSNLGDPAPEPGLQVTNQTDMPIRIFMVPEFVHPGDGSPYLVGRVAARTRGEAYFPCIVRGSRWIARAPDGTVLARRGPFERPCNYDAWVILERTGGE